MPKQVVRTLLTVILALFLYRGHRWARYLMAILFGIAAAILIGGVVKLLRDGLGRPDLILFLAASYTWSAIGLTCFPSVGKFHKLQRDRRRGARADS